LSETSAEISADLAQRLRQALAYAPALGAVLDSAQLQTRISDHF
jgi:hypothetical protein